MITLHPSVFKFLRALRKNNNRPWFNDRKDDYISAHEHTVAFVEGLMDAMSNHDELVPMTGKQSLFRIYRDTRFSKDNTPYKSGFMGRMKRATKWHRGGYYYNFAPGGNTVIAGGFWAPHKDDLHRIRKDFEMEDKDIRKITSNRTFKRMFGEMYGAELKTAPRGFPKDHPAVDLLRMKQFIVKRTFTDKEALAPNFQKEIVKTYRAMRPFFDYMSEVLTTDLNGVPIV